jgi:uncharacterized ion transporter superfamily protein YfcC
MSRTPRIALVVVGVVALVVGLVWMGQGSNLIPGSFMTGSRTWLTVGLVVGLVGVLLIWLAARRPDARRRR